MIDPRKETILKCELDLFERKHRTKEDLRKMWGKDPEAVLWFKEKFGTKEETIRPMPEPPVEEFEEQHPQIGGQEIPPPEEESSDYNRLSGGY